MNSRKKEYLFTSERLGFRHWLASDTDTFAEMNADPEVREFFPNLLTFEESLASIRRYQNHIDQAGFGFYAVDLLKSAAFIGFIGMVEATFPAAFTPCMEIGWRLKKSVWNNGYATEGAKRCLDFAFNVMEVAEVYSFTACLNKKSERVMQKIGMKKVGIFDHPKIEEGHPLKPHVLYYIKTPNLYD